VSLNCIHNFCGVSFTCVLFRALEMDGKRSMWEPWYLDVMMSTIGPNKVQCKFCSLQFIYRKDMMLNHLGYYPHGGGKGGVGLCAKARLQVRALFVRCGGNVLVALDDAQVSNSLPNLVNDRSLGSFDNSSIVHPQANGANCPPPFWPNKDDPILCQTFHLNK
jgi:hypothetical protein